MDVKGNYIAGAWVIGDELLQDLNPSNLSDVVGEFSRSSAEQTRIAIAAAREAFKSWSHSVQLRFAMLHRIGDEMLARREELGMLLSREQGVSIRRRSSGRWAGPLRARVLYRG